MIDKGTQAYKDFLSKVDYYKQLLREVQSQDIKKVAKDTNLCYEIVYTCSTLKDFLDNGELIETVGPLYNGFESYIKIIEKEAEVYRGGHIKKHKKLLKVKYGTEDYKGDYKKEYIVQHGTIGDTSIIREIASKSIPVLMLIAMYIIIKNGILETVMNILLNTLE